MNTISEILTNQYADQGIQDVQVFFDSYIFNLKVKNGSEYSNIVLIEKISFDYSTETIERLKNPIVVNFGNTGTSIPNFSNGNCFLNAFKNAEDNMIILIGLKQMNNGNTIPIIYLYNINRHSIKPVFPTASDVAQFNSFSNFTFKQDAIPSVVFRDKTLRIAFQSEDATFKYLNVITLNRVSETFVLDNYEIFKYETPTVDFINIGEGQLHFQLGAYHGILEKLADGETNPDPTIFSIDDTFSVLSFDSPSVLRLDE